MKLLRMERETDSVHEICFYQVDRKSVSLLLFKSSNEGDRWISMAKNVRDVDENWIEKLFFSRNKVSMVSLMEMIEELQGWQCKKRYHCEDDS